MSNIIFVGPPGCGKGTQADILAKEMGFLKIAAGDLLREEIRSGSEAGEEINSYILAGNLVPDNLTSKLMLKAISINKGKNIIFDGFPRSFSQAEMLDQMMNELGLKIDAVINFNLSVEVLYERICNRIICNNCQSPLNMQDPAFNLAKKCIYCGSEEFFTREDDKKEIFDRRISIYKKENSRVLEFYHQSNYSIFELDGDQDVKKVSEILKNYLLSIQRS